MKESIIDRTNKTETIVYSGVLGSLGALGSLLYESSQGAPFKLASWALRIGIAFIMAWLVGEFLPHSFEYRDGILGVAGVCSIPIARYFYRYGIKLLLKKTGLPSEEEMKEEMKK